MRSRLVLISIMVLWSTAGVFTRKISMPSYQITFFRYLTAFIFMMCVFLIKKRKIDLKKAAKDYILNMQSIASSTKKYVDKQKIQDLSDAKAGIENSTNYAILVVGARLEFLTSSGFSDDEAMQIIAPESEAVTE